MERKRTGAGEGLAEELLLDDIVIERVGEDSSAASRESVSLPEGEEIILQGEDLRPAEETPEETVRRNHPPERIVPDLEALSAEVDSLSAVDSAHGNIGAEGDDINADRLEDYELIEDLKIDDDMVVDLDAESRHNEKPDRRLKKEQTADAALAKPAQSHDDMHGDLPDDEFIILEDESGTSTAVLPSSVKSEAEYEESRIGQSVFEEHAPESPPISESTESEIEEIIRTSELPAKEEIPVEAVPIEEMPAQAAKAEDTSGLSITLSEDVAKSLSEEFDIRLLEPVDLREAEKIANEDILILKEEDLIEELDAMDLIPLDDSAISPAKAANATTTPTKPTPSNVSAGEKAHMPYDTTDAGVSADAELDVADEFPEQQPGDAEITTEAEEVIAEAPRVIEDALSVADDARNERAEDIVIEEPIVIEADEHELREAEPPPVPRSPAIEIIDEMANDTSFAGDLISASHRDAGGGGVVFEEEITPVDQYRDEFDTAVRLDEAFEREKRMPLLREKIPDEFAVAGDRGRVLIIDDVAVEKTITESESIFADEELEKTTVGLVDIVEGSARFIREASTEEDVEQMAAIMSGTAMAFEDLLVDFSEEYKFKDEDVDFIDNVFIAESASLAGAFSDEERRRKKNRLTPATEIFGLSDGELFEIETSVFTGEYKEIDLSTIKGAVPVGMDQAPADFALVKNCRYMGASSSEIWPIEKQSIEEDVVADQALVYEESVEDIRRVLSNYRRTKKQHPDDVMDISDEIVIIDDKSDIERFADTFGPEKRENIKKLLQYLDGLFEKLPEDVIRKFAESEYYNLYMRIMKELER